MDAQSRAMLGNAELFDAFCKDVEKGKGRVLVGLIFGDCTPKNPSELLIHVRDKRGEVVASERVVGTMRDTLLKLRQRVFLSE